MKERCLASLGKNRDKKLDKAVEDEDDERRGDLARLPCRRQHSGDLSRGSVRLGLRATGKDVRPT